MLLAARASGELSDADRERLSRHLSRCPACRVIEARFEQAERAYHEGRPGGLPAAVAGLIVDALAAAAPISDEVAAAATLAPVAEAPLAPTARLTFVPPDDPQPDYEEAPTGVLPLLRAPANGPQAAEQPARVPAPATTPAPSAPPAPAPAPAAAAAVRPAPVVGPQHAADAMADQEDLGGEPLASPPRADDGASAVPEFVDAEDPATAAFGAVAGGAPGHDPGTIAFAAGAARRARGALLRPGALRRRTTRPEPALRHHRRGGFAARVVAPAAIVIGGLVATLAIAGVFNSKGPNARRAASTTATTPPPAAVAQQPPAKKTHKRHHHKRTRRTVAVAAKPPVATTTPPPTTTTPRQQVATVAPAPQPKPAPSKPPASVHVVGGPTSQSPPQTGAPAGTGPSGYQPSSTP
jgi:hypothetical protein